MNARKDQNDAKPSGNGLLAGWLLFCALLALVAYLISAPFLSLHAIAVAARHQDLPAMQQRVDFDAIRASINQQLAHDGSTVATASDDEGFFASLRRWFAEKSASVTVNAITGPSGIVALVSGYGRSAMLRVLQDRAMQGIGFSARELRLPDGTRWRYESISRAVITVPERGDEQRSIDLVMQRDGLHWRLVDIRLEHLLSTDTAAS